MERRALRDSLLTLPQLGPLPDIGHDSTEAKSHDHAGTASCPTTVPFEDAYPGLSQLAQPNQDLHPHYLFAGPDYLAPASDFLFAQGTNMSPLAAYLPHQVTCDQLMIRFWEAVHPVATLVHRPTFEAQYADFWNDIASGTDPRKSTQAVVFAALFMSAVTHSPNRALSTLGIAKPALVDRLKVGTEMALSRANLLRTAKLETMQAFVMYLVSLALHVRPNQRLNFLGSAVQSRGVKSPLRADGYGHPPGRMHGAAP